MSRTYPTAPYVVTVLCDGLPLRLVTTAECAEDALREVTERGHRATIHDVALAGADAPQVREAALIFLLQRAHAELRSDPACSRDLRSEIGLMLAHIRPAVQVAA